MIPKLILKALVKRRLDDSKALINGNRFSATIYMAGYALELAFKFKICRLMKFNYGFPETAAEFNSYRSDTSKVLLRSTISEIREIRHHRLPELLRYSGEEINVTHNFISDWDRVKDWKPEMRYSNSLIRKQKAEEFLKSVRNIINGIL